MKAECKKHMGWFDVSEGCAYCVQRNRAALYSAIMNLPHEKRTWIDALYKAVSFERDVLERAVKTALGETGKVTETYNWDDAVTEILIHDTRNFDVRIRVLANPPAETRAVFETEDGEEREEDTTDYRAPVYAARKVALVELLKYDASSKGRRAFK
jgi:hypothetical protein